MGVFGCVVGASALVGCQDPCVALAERVCNCELTPLERATCRRERVTNEQSRITITDDDRSICTAKLDTCDCAALDENRLDACGFAPAVTAPADPSPGGE